jgi:hypothetical protein
VAPSAEQPLAIGIPQQLAFTCCSLLCCCFCCFLHLQVYTCEQVLSYLKQFVAVKASSAEEKKEVEAPAPGMKLLAKKGDDESDALFTGMGGKKGRGARKAAEKQKAVDTVKVRCWLRGALSIAAVVSAVIWLLGLSSCAVAWWRMLAQCAICCCDHELRRHHIVC